MHTWNRFELQGATVTAEESVEMDRQEDRLRSNRLCPQLSDNASFLDDIPGSTVRAATFSFGLRDVKDQSTILELGPQIPVITDAEPVIQYARGHRIPSFCDFVTF